MQLELVAIEMNVGRSDVDSTANTATKCIFSFWFCCHISSQLIVSVYLCWFLFGTKGCVKIDGTAIIHLAIDMGIILYGTIWARVIHHEPYNLLHLTCVNAFWPTFCMLFLTIYREKKKPIKRTNTCIECSAWLNFTGERYGIEMKLILVEWKWTGCVALCGQNRAACYCRHCYTTVVATATTAPCIRHTMCPWLYIYIHSSFAR